MKLDQLFSSVPATPDFAQYKKRTNEGMPPIDVSALKMIASGGKRDFIRTPYEGTGSLLITYKNHEGALTSVHETPDGDEWGIVQVQGAKSQKSLRVAACVRWQECFADQLRSFALHPEAEVQRLTMQPLYHVTNITDAKNFDGAQRSYEIVRSALNMKFSESDQLFIAEVTRANAGHVLCPTTFQQGREWVQKK